MATEPARSRSAELIDFEQAKSQHSKQRIRTGLETLIELEELIARKLRSEHQPHSPSDSSRSPLVTTEPGPILVSNIFIADSIRGFDPQDSLTQFEEIGCEFRRIGERLSDLEAKIVGLESPGRVGLDENVDNALDRRLNSPGQGAQIGVVGEKTDHFGARFLRRLRHATTPSRRRLLQSFSSNQPILRAIFTGVKPLTTAMINGARNSDFAARLNDNRSIGKSRHGGITDGPADHLKSTMALLGALTLLGFFLLFGPKPVKQASIPPVASHAQGEAPGASAAKMTAAAPRVDLKVNSLQPTVNILSPQLISGSLNIESRPQPSRQQEAPDPARTVEDLAPQTATAPAARLDNDKDEMDTSEATGDAQEQYERASELYKSGDIKGAIALLERSAREGNSQAQLQLGNLYLKGVGVSRNFTQARKWLERAANNGDAFAMHNLAVFYSGGDGHKADHARASDWFRRAAERGVVDSMFNLGVAYSDGLGVEKDAIQAYAWFSLAASRGDAKAAQKRKNIGKLLNREDLYEAKLLGDSLNSAQRSR